MTAFVAERHHRLPFPSAYRRLRRAAASALAGFLLAGCASFQIPFFGDSSADREIDLIAVLPVTSSAPPAGKEGGDIAAPGEKAVSAAIYGALSGSYEWRFVPDLTVADALRNVDELASRQSQAVALGKAVNADGVLSGSVWRFVERVGDSEAADSGASVGFTLQLTSVASGKVLWEYSFDRTQTEGSWTVPDWVPYWESGPQWMSAAELTQIGVDEAIRDLRRTLD